MYVKYIHICTYYVLLVNANKPMERVQLRDTMGTEDPRQVVRIYIERLSVCTDGCSITNCSVSNEYCNTNGIYIK